MADVVNTNVEALRAIKDSLIKFQERISPLQGELSRSFDEIDQQLVENYKRYERKLEERRRKGSEEGMTDSFACDKCGGRIRLKIQGDTTRCRENGCNGSLHRVYTNNTYTKQQRERDKEELNEMRSLIKAYSEQKGQMVSLFANFFSSDAGDLESRKLSLGKCIDALDQYLNLDVDVNVVETGKKKR